MDQSGSDDREWSILLSRKERLFLPALRGPVERVKQGDTGGFEELIRTAYRLMAAYGRNEGHRIAFDLSDFKTVAAPEALSLKYSDLVSVGLPDHIAVGGVIREFKQDDRMVSVKRGYSMRWEPLPPDPDAAGWKKRLVSEFVKLALPDQPALPYLRAVTSYRVVVTLDGARRDYRAAFFWMGSATSPAIQTISCFDPVTSGVTLVLAEQVPPAPERPPDPEIPKETCPLLVALTDGVRLVLGFPGARLQPQRPDRRRRRGNQFRYRGKVTLADGKKSHSVDVFLLTD